MRSTSDRTVWLGDDGGDVETGLNQSLERRDGKHRRPHKNNAHQLGRT